ncbi:MAG: Uma2 family endonuclease [Phycisphaerae bacterium]|nr:Uma2 family endonuclease [Phycisphaerae bacterium]
MTTIIRPNLEHAGEYRGLRMTADEFLALPESKCHYELINGIVTMSPSPSMRHQEIVREILVQLATFLRGRGLEHAVHDVDARFAADLVYRPDVIYLSAEKFARCSARVTEIPDLVVEVISPDSRRYDHETKKDDYERYGVQEYWLVDGRKWHLEQRTSREGKPKHWEAAALEYVIDLVQENGGFAPTNWNERASVEVTADGAESWFLHVLTGDEWLLQLCFLVPPGTFEWRALDRQLGLKTLDERGDLETYGHWSRVDIRPRQRGGEAVVIYVHDKQEIDTPGFRKFIRTAARAYLESVGGVASA